MLQLHSGIFGKPVFEICNAYRPDPRSLRSHICPNHILNNRTMWVPQTFDHCEMSLVRICYTARRTIQPSPDLGHHFRLPDEFGSDTFAAAHSAAAVICCVI